MIEIRRREVSDASDKPDEATTRAPDWTASEAPDRSFYINLGFFKYGTADKVHGAAVLFSVLLLIVIVTLIFTGPFLGLPDAWLDRVFTWLGSAFLFVAGVAVGRAGDVGNKSP